MAMMQGNTYLCLCQLVDGGGYFSDYQGISSSVQ